MNRPDIKSDGNYDPVQLYAYIGESIQNNTPPFVMARELNVTIDRITYMIGPGLMQYKRRAELSQREAAE